jgi:hypothetical protein
MALDLLSLTIARLDEPQMGHTTTIEDHTEAEELVHQASNDHEGTNHNG